MCIDCGEGLGLGKSHIVKSEFHEKTSHGFSCIGNVTDPASERAKSFLVALQHFLVLHRQHQLRVLPDNSAAVQEAWHWFEFLDGEEGELHHLLSVPVKPPQPDHEPDREEPIDDQILHRLRTNAKQAEQRYIGTWKRE